MWGFDSSPKSTPKACIYDADESNALTPQQKQSIQELKASEGWVNGQTPPPGCVIDQHGYATASNVLVSAVAQSIGAATSNANSMVPPLPPAPSPTSVPPPARNNSIPPVIQTNASTAGSSFGRPGVRSTPGDDNSVSQVSMVSINGRNYNGPVFDSNGQRLA